MVTAYKQLEKEIKELKIRLAEYEPIESDQDKEAEFNKFWVMYGKKGNVKTSRKRFDKLSDKKKALIFKVLPDYILSTPDKPYRKNAEGWLNQECWNDSIESEFKPQQRAKVGAYKLVKKKVRDYTVDEYTNMATGKAKQILNNSDSNLTAEEMLAKLK